MTVMVKSKDGHNVGYIQRHLAKNVTKGEGTVEVYLTRQDAASGQGSYFEVQASDYEVVNQGLCSQIRESDSNQSNGN